MEKDLIIKALECCFSDGSCDGCPYTERVDCRRELERNALSLIKELTEENERLRGCVMSEEQVRNIANETIQQGIFIIKADTVRKMQSEIEARCIKGGIYPAFVARVVDEVVKEMLEERNDTR